MPNVDKVIGLVLTERNRKKLKLSPVGPFVSVLED